MSVRLGKQSRSRLFHVALLLLCCSTETLLAGKLNPSGWKLLDPALIDNNLATCATNMQIPVDLGNTNTIDRVYLTGTNRLLQYWPNAQSATNPPLGVVTVCVGNTFPPTNQVGSFTVPYDAGNPVDTEVDIRFSPVMGRYVLIQFNTNIFWGTNYWPGWALASQPAEPPNLTWRVSELQLYGYNGTFTNRDAVVKATNSIASANGTIFPLDVAAGDLSYYLSELEGYPVPIITPGQTNLFPGTIYRPVDLRSLAPDYTTMMTNITSGALTTNVMVQVFGREVQFSGWPYRCVLWGVWEFLERQGVRWVYPDALGDYVPTGNGISLSFLPLNFTPSARSVYANWPVQSFQPWAPWQLQSLRQSYLYAWRNRWNSTQGAGSGPLGGSEIPAASAPGNLNTNYAEQFVGYPHNFPSVVPNWKLLQNPNWWGYDPSLGWVNPTNGVETITFSMNNPGLVSWVANKMVAVDTAYPIPSKYPLNIVHFNNSYNLLPLDATIFSQDTNWDLPANGPVLPAGDAWVNAGVTQSFSGEYFSFVTKVASNVTQLGSSALVGSLAYGPVYEPPVNITTFPGNVQVEVCMYGAPNLSTLSWVNANLKTAWDTWHAKCSRLATYDYTLLHTDYWQTNNTLPVPLVAGIVDRAQYLAQLGTLDGGCQATPDSIQYNPWNFYAYPRIRWNVSQTATQLEQEFFNDYFGEAAGPMLAYYTVLENNAFNNNVNMHVHGYCYTLTPGSFPINVLYVMQTNLAAAESLATNWVTIQRVANIAAGFNWVLNQEGLTGVNLNDPAPYQQIGSSGVTLDLSTFSPLQTVAGSSGSPFVNNPIFTASPTYWQLQNPNSIQKTLNLLQAGTYAITASASRSIYAKSSSVVLTVTLGGSTTNLTVTSTNYSTFTVNLPASAGAQTLVLDDWCSPADGFTVDINQIQIARTSLFNPILQVTPGSIGYGTVMVGTSATNSFTVMNIGTGTLSGTASVGSPFSIVSGGNYSLTAGQTQAVMVAFSPLAVSNYTQSVSFSGGGATNVLVSGSAINESIMPPGGLEVISSGP
jgi:hypothetical protein